MNFLGKFSIRASNGFVPSFIATWDPSGQTSGTAFCAYNAGGGFGLEDNCVCQLTVPPPGATAPADLWFIDFWLGAALSYVLRCGCSDRSIAPIFGLVPQQPSQGAIFMAGTSAPPNIGPVSLAIYKQRNDPESLTEWLGWPNGGAPATVTYATETLAPCAAVIASVLHNAAPSGSDYSWADLSHETYSGFAMPQANFTFADLTNTLFRGSTLTGAIFDNALMNGTNFNGAHLEGARLSDMATFDNLVLLNAFLANASLDGIDFTEFDFAGASFANKNLPPATFVGATLTNANFTGCNLTGVDFSSVKSLAGANFTNATLDSAIFQGVSSLTGVDFTGASMAGTNFSGLDLTAATFSATPSFSTDPNNLTNLSGATLDAALIGANWTCLNLASATINNLPASITNLNATSSILNGLTLTNMSLVSAIFSGAQIRGVSFASTDLTFATFDSAANGEADDTYSAVSFAGANLMDANFSGALMSGAAFTSAFFWGGTATLDGATISGADFANAYLPGLGFGNLQQNQCLGVTFDGACLVNAVFDGADLRTNGLKPASFVKTALQGASFAKANLDGCNLTDAAVATASSGSLQITIAIPPSTTPSKEPLQYEQATTGLEAATSIATFCPSGANGPCTGGNLVSPNAPMKSWPGSDATSSPG